MGRLGATVRHDELATCASASRARRLLRRLPRRRPQTDWRADHGVGSLRAAGIATSVNEQSIVEYGTRQRRRRCSGRPSRTVGVRNIGGLSGAPLFAFWESSMVFWKLAGVIYEGGGVTFEHVRAAHGDRIRIDGTIDGLSNLISREHPVVLCLIKLSRIPTTHAERGDKFGRMPPAATTPAACPAHLGWTSQVPAASRPAPDLGRCTRGGPNTTRAIPFTSPFAALLPSPPSALTTSSATCAFHSPPRTNESFRLLHFSVQLDHLHLIVEVDRGPDLAHGVQRLAIRCARAINRALGDEAPSGRSVITVTRCAARAKYAWPWRTCCSTFASTCAPHLALLTQLGPVVRRLGAQGDAARNALPRWSAAHLAGIPSAGNAAAVPSTAARRPRPRSAVCGYINKHSRTPRLRRGAS